MRPQLQDVLAQTLARQHVQCREGLVHQQHFRVGDQGAGDAHPLLHAASSRGSALSKPDRPISSMASCARRSRSSDATPLRFQAQLDVLLDGQPGKRAKDWKDHADAPAPCHIQRLLAVHHFAMVPGASPP